MESKERMSKAAEKRARREVVALVIEWKQYLSTNNLKRKENFKSDYERRRKQYEKYGKENFFHDLVKTICYEKGVVFDLN